MSMTFNEVESSNRGVMEAHGCKVVFGQGGLSITALSELLLDAPPDASIFTNAARYAGAALVIGSEKNVSALLPGLRLVYRAKVLKEWGRLPVVDGLLDWVVLGDVGSSSAMMVRHLVGSDYCIPGHSASGGAPCDSADFARCLKLSRDVPLIGKRLARMSGVSATWAAVMDRWDAMAEQYDLGTESARRKITEMLQEARDTARD